MPLVLAPIGQEMKIVRVAVDERTKKHLSSLGIFVGETVTVLSAGGGSVVCKVKEGRLALDGQVASHIFVA
ncbi:MAG: ferrous iron transport protein A [Clostridia bacterium]|nr:ferrous iron transport protein A [Clostridia bacterium]